MDENKQRLVYEPVIKQISDRLNNTVERLVYLEKNGVPGLRDFVATSALAILARDTNSFHTEAVKELAKFCYDVAEAFVEEKKKRAPAQ